MWTNEKRCRYGRSRLRYPSDLTDDEESSRRVDPAGQAWRRQAHGDHARGGERADVHSVDRLSVAADPDKDTVRNERHVPALRPGLAVAAKTIANFSEKPCRLYEKKAQRGYRRGCA